MIDSDVPHQSPGRTTKAAEEEDRTLKDPRQALGGDIKAQITNYNKTGRRLVTLGVLLEVLLGAVTIPLAFAVYSGIHAFIEENPGGLALPGLLVGIGIAVAGVFYAAARMLDAIPAILAARNDNAAKILESLRTVVVESRDAKAPSA
jgi:hypothetical protein